MYSFNTQFRGSILSAELKLNGLSRNIREVIAVVGSMVGNRKNIFEKRRLIRRIRSFNDRFNYAFIR